MFRLTSKLRHWQLGLPVLLLGLLSAAPGRAAETVVLRYGPFEESLAVKDLRTYAETRKASPQLAELLDLLPPENQNRVYELLQLKQPIDRAKVEKHLESPQGRAILTDAAKVTQRNNPAGVQALRAGIVRGTQVKGGLGIVSFLEAYPAKIISIDMSQAPKFFAKNKTLLDAAKRQLPATKL